MTRRMQHYDDLSWQPYMICACLGAVVILCGILCQVAQLVVSIRQRHRLSDVTGDPWDGRSLEWATASPPPVFNFAVLPDVHSEEAYWGMKARALSLSRLADAPAYQDIDMPRNTPVGVFTAFFASIAGFALIWHIWWMVLIGLAGAFAVLVALAWRQEDEFVIPATEVERLDRERRHIREQMLATLR